MDSRRNFLQTLSASILALSIPQAGFASLDDFYSQPYEGPVLRVAIMGLGSYGTRVAEAMQACKMAKLVGLISGTPSKIKNWQSKPRYYKNDLKKNRSTKYCPMPLLWSAKQPVVF